MRARVEGTSVLGIERAFTESFTVGRGMQATLHVDSGRVSRLHAEVVFEEGEAGAPGRWIARDAGSTNGTYYRGERVEEVVLEGDTAVRLGREGPFLYLSVLSTERGGGEPSGRADRPAGPTTPDAHAPLGSGLGSGLQRPAEPPRAAVRAEAPETSVGSSEVGSSEVGSKEGGPASREGVAPEPRAAEPGAAEPGSVSQVIRHYFDEDRPAGAQTMMIRQAFHEVQKKQKRTYGTVLAAAAVLLAAVLGLAAWQQVRVSRLQDSTETLFYEMKEQDLGIAELRLFAAEAEDGDFAARLESLQAGRRRTAERYEGYVEELGLYRKLTPEEREIYRIARIFNESEFTMPAGFVREVEAVIAEWQQTERFERALQTAEENGYTRLIVETLVDYGLPPEFFYLALQESDFVPCRVGPPTRWGIAKGMWQFIPMTARRFGLQPGPREDQRAPDPDDERCDVEKATDAAARYLLTIYTDLAQASGLLVMASYNWGEHRVGPKLDELTPLEVLRQDLADIPENPQARNYWRFLSEYRDRMPEQTKDYVLHIFAAAVIGQNPRLFGFDFDNPLQRYIEEAVTPAIARAPVRP